MVSKCDGLWVVQDGAECEAPVVKVCVCRRCESEGDDGAFHLCADPAHRRLADAKHFRIYEKHAAWGKL